jgi:hypothetical protein
VLKKHYKIWIKAFDGLSWTNLHERPSLTLSQNYLTDIER